MLPFMLTFLLIIFLLYILTVDHSANESLKKKICFAYTLYFKDLYHIPLGRSRFQGEPSKILQFILISKIHFSTFS